MKLFTLLMTLAITSSYANEVFFTNYDVTGQTDDNSDALVQHTSNPGNPGDQCSDGGLAGLTQAECQTFSEEHFVNTHGPPGNNNFAFSNAGYPSGCLIRLNDDQILFNNLAENQINSNNGCGQAQQQQDWHCVCNSGPASVDCVGTWSNCPADCTGDRTFSETTAASGGGQTCTALFGGEDGDSQACVGTGSGMGDCCDCDCKKTRMTSGNFQDCPVI